jgi:hypothetical protein
MTSAVINTREDLDAIAGTPEHAAFMAMLRGSLWRLEKDDSAGAWRAVEDDSSITRFGFSRADFPSSVVPELPAYAPPPPDVPQAVSMRQARLALLGANLLPQVNAAIAGMPGEEGEAARIEWEYAQEVRRDSSLVKALALAMGMSDADLDSLFKSAAGI